MASLFVFPQTFRSLEQDYDDNRLSVQNPTEVASLSPSQLEEFVKGSSFSTLFTTFCSSISEHISYHIISPPLISLLHSSFPLISLGISFDLSDKDLFCVEEQDIFDRVYSLIRDYKHLSPSCKLNIVESLRSNFSVLLPNIDSLARASPSNDGDAPVLDQIASHRNAFKIYTFFLLHIVNSEEASASSSNNSKVFF